MAETAVIQITAAENAVRAEDLRNTLGTMALEGHYLDQKSLAIYDRYVRGEIDLETVGRLFDEVIYSNNPGARLDA